VAIIGIDAKTAVNLAEDLAYPGLADGIIVSGGLPGFSGRTVDPTIVERVKKRKIFSNIPVLVAGGITTDNVQPYLEVCDGVIISSYLRVNCISTNPYPERVKKFAAKVKELLG
jgi:predicted TIM-barrel enzyme